MENLSLSSSRLPSNPNKSRKRKTDTESKGKKKRKTDDSPASDKSKKQASESPSEEPSVTNEEPSISTADFLSAIVAAATATASPDSSSSQQWNAPSQPVSSTISPESILNTAVASTSSRNEPPAGEGTSNEAVLRALQDLDISKIASVLKALTDAQNAAFPVDAAQIGLDTPLNVPLNPAILASLMNQEPPPVNQVPVSAGKILGGSTNTAHVVETTNSAEDAHLLATKWYSAGKLAELAKTRGLVFKKGKFSAIEEQQLNSAIENYRIAKQLNQDQLNEIIFPKDEKSKDNAFWSEITAAVPQRPIISIYHHVRRTYHPFKQQGKWSTEEDDKLREAVASMGQQWEKISLVVGRRAPDCRDRYRNHVVGRETRVVGPWTTEEEEQLQCIVEDMTVNRGGTLDDEVFWSAVAQKMGGRRNRQQCRNKWTDVLSKQVKSNGQNPRWSNQDAYILVHKLDSLRVRDDTEVDWKTLADKDWNLWSPHILQRRWQTMKKSVKGYEEMTHQEIMEILKAKKTNFDPTPTTGIRKNKRKKPTSPEMVEG
ncbi:RNA polymerase I enhancer binding protein [Stygiomarasmius scandens]|uniref:RNA polymerase I enhancer binding protein n=1 Tax=Marasmiellus scandens TaxID=2682957 RepID=A0ABR1K1P8_9AGAR